MTLKEYSEDYASEEVKHKIANLLKLEIEHISNQKIKVKTLENIEKITSGERDFRF